MTIKTTTFDMSDYLDSPEMIQEYIQAAIEDADPVALRLALADVAKAKGMSTIAADTKLNRQNLYKSLSENGNPSFNTINKVMKACGLKLQVANI